MSKIDFLQKMEKAVIDKQLAILKQKKIDYVVKILDANNISDEYIPLALKFIGTQRQNSARLYRMIHSLLSQNFTHEQILIFIQLRANARNKKKYIGRVQKLYAQLIKLKTKNENII